MAQVPSNLIPVRVSQLPDSPEASLDGYLLFMYQGNTYKIRAGDLVSVSGVPTTTQVIAGTGLTGGGQLTGNVTLSIAPGGVGSTELAAAGVTPGVYGTGLAVPQITVDATGRVTAATEIDITAGGLGTVTSVDVSGGSTGLTTSGGPVTNSGTITLGGTLAVAAGGTGSTTATGARANLSAAASGANSDITSLSGVTGGVSSPDYIDFDVSAAPARATGRLWWDNADGNQTLSLGMAGSNATLQVGQETYYRIKASADIAEGEVVMFSGTVGASGALRGAPATGLSPDTAAYVMGVATESILTNEWGYVTAFGLVRGVDTTGGAESWVDGDILYYDPTVAGGLTKTPPSAPNAKVQLAAVVHAAANGSLFVRATYGGQLGQFEGDVSIASVASNNFLVYDTNKWVNKTAADSRTALGLGTVATQNANNVSITGGSISGITDLAIADGGTGASTAGAARSNLLPAYASNTGKVLAVNGSETDVEWVAVGGSGTVTSVALTAPTGFAVTGSPVTTTGTLALAYDTGYALPTTASQTNWDTAYSDRLKWDGGATGLDSATGRTSLGLGSAATMTGPSGSIVGTTDAQTLTNKTIAYADNTLTGVQPTLVSGTSIKTINSTTLLGSGDIAVVAATSGTASGITLNDGYTEEVFAVSGTTPALSPTNGSIQTWTLTGNSTPTAGTWAAGQSLTLMIDDGTAYTVTWTSLPVTWVGGSAPTLPTSGYAVIELWKVGTTIYGASVGDVA